MKTWCYLQLVHKLVTDVGYEWIIIKYGNPLLKLLCKPLYRYMHTCKDLIIVVIVAFLSLLHCSIKRTRVFKTVYEYWVITANLQYGKQSGMSQNYVEQCKALFAKFPKFLLYKIFIPVLFCIPTVSVLPWSQLRR